MVPGLLDRCSAVCNIVVIVEFMSRHELSDPEVTVKIDCPVDINLIVQDLWYGGCPK